MVLKHSSIALAIAVVLTACGGSDSGSASTSSTSSSANSSSLTARAADGYLIGANACLDLNNNKVCESSEPNAVTGDNGEFTLTGLSAEQIAKGVLLIEVVAGQTIDSDNPGMVLTQGYNLTAPPGSDFISPLTTMLQNEMEKGSSIEEAKSKVQQKIGTSIDVTKDYIAAKNSVELSSTDKAVYEKLHKIAQVTASIMASKTDSLKEVSAGAGISEHELISLIVEEVTMVLENVVADISNNAGQFDAKAIATEIERENIDLDKNNLSDKIKENEAKKKGVIINHAKELYEEGIHWLAGTTHADKPMTLQFGSVQFRSDGGIQESSKVYDYTVGDFVLAAEKLPSLQMVLANNGWQSENAAIEKIEVLDNHKIKLTSADSVLSDIVSIMKIDVSGVNVRSIVKQVDSSGAWSNTLPADLVFPDNTVMYKQSLTKSIEGYYSFYKGKGCKGEDRYVELNNSCNGFSVFKDNQEKWLTSLEQTKVVDQSDRSGTFNVDGLVPFGAMKRGGIRAQLLDGGEVKYYFYSWYNEPLELLPEAGQWRDIVVNGVQLREVSMPATIIDVASQVAVNPKDRKSYLSVAEGFVRNTWYIPSASTREEYVFDSTTQQFILDRSFQPLNLQACLDSLADAGYEKTIGDKIVYDVSRTFTGGVPTSLQFHSEYLGNNFSWLDDVTNVTGLPSWISDWAGRLEKTKVSELDLQGALVGYEYAYSTPEHYLGQEGFNQHDERIHGIAKVGLPTAVAHKTKQLGVEKAHARAINAPLTAVFDTSTVPAQLVTHGLRTADTEIALSAITDAWHKSVFDYSETYLGKERVTVPAGTFDTCKLISKTNFPGANKTDTAVTWLINKGIVKKDRNEPSWNAKIEIEAKSL
ncbi:hypothetical protein L1D14_19600 [Vibrio tubiashii]|uniref:hypothetical protein n=1 Tax=Vibrio tubiashii TaxID=29498 RepID=UPI001EFCF86E|nr:hypothetical protein [Vibrio tubiashii]MCG9578427.1 hypothetical protein [Vibrio tubiashii]